MLLIWICAAKLGTMTSLNFGEFCKLKTFQLANVKLEGEGESCNIRELSSLTLNLNLEIIMENLNTIFNRTEESKLDSVTISANDVEEVDDLTETILEIHLQQMIFWIPHLTKFQCNILYSGLAFSVLSALFSCLTNLIDLHLEFKSSHDDY